jgi:signal transduction histidine kinase
MLRLNEETKTAATFAERDRLAGEIHDSLQQGLSGLILQLDATLKLSELTKEVRARLNVARSMVSFTRHEVQHAVWDMESPLLVGTELGDALRKITALISPGAAHIEVRVLGRSFPLSSEIKHHLLRIAQEAITNAVRHAAAHPIEVQLKYELDDVALTVSDEGPGFDPDGVLTNRLGHFGLRGLQARAGKINGELRIDSSPGKGTSIKVVVPIGKPDHAITHPV